LPTETLALPLTRARRSVADARAEPQLRVKLIQNFQSDLWMDPDNTNMVEIQTTESGVPAASSIQSLPNHIREVELADFPLSLPHMGSE